VITKIVTMLEGFLKLNRATENLLIDIVASYSPWIAPVVPAYMTYQNMTTHLAFPDWAGLAAAICVETLGFSSIQTAVSFWQWNDSANKSDPKAPVLLAILTGSFYLLTVLTVNAMLDNSNGVYRLAKALLSSLSVCAGVILALRAGHSRRLSEVEKAKQERKIERAALRAEKANRLSRQAKVKTVPFAQTIQMSNNGNGTRKEASTQ
jgi:hypothetical protein